METRIGTAKKYQAAVKRIADDVRIFIVNANESGCNSEDTREKMGDMIADYVDPFVKTDDSALDILRFTDNRDIYTGLNGVSDGGVFCNGRIDWQEIASDAMQEDILDRLQVEVNNIIDDINKRVNG
jgi:hypothetical protein